MRYFIVSYQMSYSRSIRWGEVPIITNGEFPSRSKLLVTLGIYSNVPRLLAFTEVKNIEELRTFIDNPEFEDKPNYPGNGYTDES